MTEKAIIHHKLYTAIKDKPGARFYLNDLAGDVFDTKGEPVLFDVEHAIDDAGTHYMMHAFRGFDRSISVEVIELTKEDIDQFEHDMSATPGTDVVIIEREGVKIEIERDSSTRVSVATRKREGQSNSGHQLASITDIYIHSIDPLIELYALDKELIIHDDSLFISLNRNSDIAPLSLGEEAQAASVHYATAREKAVSLVDDEDNRMRA